MRLLSLWLVLGLLVGRAEALEVWLASSESCNACAIYERVAQQRGYGRALQYPDRGGLTIPILSTTKNVLAADVVAQLPEDLGPTSPFWDLQLLVLVMDVDRVVFAGNIAESADNRELRQPDAVMFPPSVCHRAQLHGPPCRHDPRGADERRAQTDLATPVP
jgi:hypothetical protein